MQPHDEKVYSQEIRNLLAEFNDPRSDNEPVLGVEIIAMQQARNKGFPAFMYHPSHPPVQVLNKKQKIALEERGYGSVYRHKTHPKMLVRRNWKKIEIPIGNSKETEIVPKFEDFVETITAKDVSHEEQLKALRPPYNCTPWVDSHAELPPMPDELEEDPQITIARLRGQLEGSAPQAPQAPIEVRRGPGRPPRQPEPQEVGV